MRLVKPLLFIVMLLAFAQSITPAFAGDEGCENAPTAIVEVGDAARVTEDPPLSNRLRRLPNTIADILTLMPPGAEIAIIGGPRCNEGLRWWRVRYGSLTGWTADGEDGVNWIEPVATRPAATSTPRVTTTPRPVVTATPTATTNQPRCADAPPVQLEIGDMARINADDNSPNVLYMYANGNSESVAIIPRSADITIVRGPLCNGGMRWWRVTYNGKVGWTPDGRGDTYYLIPD